MTKITSTFILGCCICALRVCGGTAYADIHTDTTAESANAVLHTDSTAIDLSLPAPETENQKNDDVAPEVPAPSAAEELPSTSGIAPGGDVNKFTLDLQLDMGTGLSLTNSLVKPSFIKTGPQPFVLFDLAVVAPLSDRWFAAIGGRFKRLTLKYNDSIPMIANDTIVQYTKRSTDEWLNYFSVPVTVGAYFKIGNTMPYLFLTLDPSYQTSAGRTTDIESYILFKDRVVYTTKIRDQRDLTKYRRRTQVFAGPGAGVEIYYGYGTVYLSTGVLIALQEIGYEQSSPARTKTILYYVPMVLGLRFYL